MSEPGTEAWEAFIETVSDAYRALKGLPSDAGVSWKGWSYARTGAVQVTLRASDEDEDGDS